MITKYNKRKLWSLGKNRYGGRFSRGGWKTNRPVKNARTAKESGRKEPRFYDSYPLYLKKREEPKSGQAKQDISGRKAPRAKYYVNPLNNPANRLPTTKTESRPQSEKIGTKKKTKTKGKDQPKDGPMYRKKVVGKKNTRPFGLPDSPLTTDVGGIPNMIPAKTENRKSRKPASMGSRELIAGQTYHTTVTAGKYLSKSMNAIKKIAGTTSRVVRDSERETYWSNDGRDSQHLDHGFNQKRISLMPVYFSSANYMLTQVIGVNDSTWAESAIGTRKQYAAVIRHTQRLKLHNTNTFHNVNMKVSIVGLKDTTIQTVQFFNGLFNTTTSAQSDGAVPVIKQFKTVDGRDAGTNTAWSTILVDPGTNITRCAAFRDVAFVAKVCTRKLGPNDTWIFTLNQRFGSGMSISDLVQLEQEANAQLKPVKYFIMVEQWGPQCEGIEVTGTSPIESTPRIGRAPAWTYFEIRDEIEYINAIRSVDTDGGDPTYGGNVYIREFSSTVGDDATTEKLANIDSANIISDTSAPAVGEMWIPVVSDALRTTEFPKAGQLPD